MMCPGKIAAGEESDRLQFAWIRRVENRDSVAEHVADVEVPTVSHHLNAVRASANIAVGDMTEALSNTLRRNRGFLRARLPGIVCQRRKPQQTFSAIAPVDRRHVPLHSLTSFYFNTYFVTPRTVASAVYRLPAASSAIPSPIAPSGVSVSWPGMNIVTLPSLRLPIRMPFFQPGCVCAVDSESAA